MGFILITLILFYHHKASKRQYNIVRVPKYFFNFLRVRHHNNEVDVRVDFTDRMFN